MKKSLNLLLFGCATFAMMTCAGCQKKGPMENAGEKVDQAAEVTTAAINTSAVPSRGHGVWCADHRPIVPHRSA